MTDTIEIKVNGLEIPPVFLDPAWVCSKLAGQHGVSTA